MTHDFPEFQRRSPAFSTAVVVAAVCAMVGGGYAIGYGPILAAVAGMGFFAVVVALQWGEFGLLVLAVASLVLPFRLGVLLTPVVRIVGDLPLVEVALVAWGVCA